MMENMSNKIKINPVLRALLAVLAVTAYVIVGAMCDHGWSRGWLIFLLIPVIESFVTAVKTRDPSAFAYPVFVTGVFLLTGMFWGCWHPMWVLFVTIPLYYIICDAVKKALPPQPDTAQNPQVEFYQPPVANQPGEQYYPPADAPYHPTKPSAKGKKVVAIVALVGIIVFATVGTAMTLLNSDQHSGNDSVQQTGSSTVKAEDVVSIDIEWISGNIVIEYYDGEDIVFTESGDVSKCRLEYDIDGLRLDIDECGDAYKAKKMGGLHKDLLVQLPRGYAMSELLLETVSATVTADDIDTQVLEVETVSGDMDIELSAQPRRIEAESVSGDINLTVPADISGYTIHRKGVSGSVVTPDADDATVYGDGAVKIDFDTVSGDLNISRGK